MKRHLFGVVAAMLCSGAAWAQELDVVVDIAPVHSIVESVMKGVGTPVLIMRPEESPHEFALRPSTAKSIQDADVVFWMGEALVPNLEKPLDNLADRALIVELTDAEGLTTHNFREVAVFGAHDDHDDHDDHDHGKHDDHDEHDDHYEAHEEEGHDGHDHDHDGLDPHMWLDPENAKVWAVHVAEVLSAADPKNAALYTSNADQLVADIDALSQEINDLLEPVAHHSFVVFHDAYQYFEHRFGLKAAGALLVSDGQSPSAARLVEVQEVIEEENISCVFVEPQFNPRLINAVAAKAKTGEMDPLGMAHTPGSDLYFGVLRGLAQSVADCLRD